MPHYTYIYSSVPDNLLALLGRDLPYSLPLLRRLQFTRIDPKKSSTARIVLVADTNDFNQSSTNPESFIAAWVDVAGGPDTQMWLYSTIEFVGNADDPDKVKASEEQLTLIVDALVKIRKDHPGELAYPGGVLLGTLNSQVRRLLEKSGRVERRPTGYYDKWIFSSLSMPHYRDALPEGMYWSAASEDDCRVVISRTNIPRTVDSLSRVPNLVIKLEDGTPICWAFLAPDGSLASLHCEEPYRGRGLAKTLASKLFRERTSDFGGEEWCSADVASDNEGSRGLCKSLNGKPHWVVSWILLDISERPGKA